MMKYITVSLILAMIFAYTPMFAQEESEGFVEVAPEYPGGEAAMMKFIRDNITYPEVAREMGIQGTVYIQFVVEKDGSMTNFNVLRGVSDEIDAEALRVLKMMPKWKPGMQKGEAVRTQFTIPIKFVLSDGDEDDNNGKEKKWWQFWKKK